MCESSRESHRRCGHSKHVGEILLPTEFVDQRCIDQSLAGVHVNPATTICVRPPGTANEKREDGGVNSFGAISKRLHLTEDVVSKINYESGSIEPGSPIWPVQ